MYFSLQTVFPCTSYRLWSIVILCIMLALQLFGYFKNVGTKVYTALLFLERKWQQRWTSDWTCRGSRSILPQVLECRLIFGKKLKEQGKTIFYLAMTGYGLFGTNIFKWKPVNLICTVRWGNYGMQQWGMNNIEIISNSK